MARFTINIDIDNAAFKPTPFIELIRLLGWVTEQVELRKTDGCIIDYNGNVVGEYFLEKEEL